MNKYDLFIDALLEFDLLVRSNEGFNEEKFTNLCSLLYELKEPIQSKQVVPIKLANVFIDMYTALESSAYRHNEEIKQRILYAADELAAIARDITSIN